MQTDEEPLDPGRPIVDPHLHVWEIFPVPGLLQEPQRFLFDELLETLDASGHNITHTVFVECHQMYRADGPDELRSLGETEFANGVAAMSASGGYGPRRIAHRIVGNVNLTLGDRAGFVLDAHIAAAGERFRGVRMNTAFSEEGLFGHPCDPAIASVLRDPALIEGARELEKRGLSLDVWCMHTQIADLAAVADASPGLTIVLDHVGTPECLGQWQERGDDAFREWRGAIAELALRPNVRIKLGGMGMDISGPIGTRTGPNSSERLAASWRRRIEACIEAFGPSRAMFESNFPPDKAAGSYGATWNAFKRIAAQYSKDEQDSLFRRTASETYHIA